MAFSGLLNNIASDLFHLIVEYFTRFVHKFLKSSSIQKTIKPTPRNSRQSFPVLDMILCLRLPVRDGSDGLISASLLIGKCNATPFEMLKCGHRWAPWSARGTQPKTQTSESNHSSFQMHRKPNKTVNIRIGCGNWIKTPWKVHTVIFVLYLRNTPLSCDGLSRLLARRLRMIDAMPRAPDFSSLCMLSWVSGMRPCRSG